MRHALFVALRLRHVIVAILHDLQYFRIRALPAEFGLEVESIVLHAVRRERFLHAGETVAHHFAENLNSPRLLLLVRQVKLTGLNLDIVDRANVFEHDDHHLFESSAKILVNIKVFGDALLLLLVARHRRERRLQERVHRFLPGFARVLR